MMLMMIMMMIKKRNKKRNKKKKKKENINQILIKRKIIGLSQTINQWVHVTVVSQSSMRG